MTLQCDGYFIINWELIMKILKITEDTIINKCIVYKYNTKTKKELLLWDFSNGSFNAFIKWYGLPLRYRIEYCRIR